MFRLWVWVLGVLGLVSGTIRDTVNEVRDPGLGDLNIIQSLALFRVILAFLVQNHTSVQVQSST